jgi:hypothetical protein
MATTSAATWTKLTTAGTGRAILMHTATAQRVFYTPCASRDTPTIGQPLANWSLCLSHPTRAYLAANVWMAQRPWCRATGQWTHSVPSAQAPTTVPMDQRVSPLYPWATLACACVCPDSLHSKGGLRCILTDGLSIGVRLTSPMGFFSIHTPLVSLWTVQTACT